jgi:hypothetical protein
MAAATASDMTASAIMVSTKVKPFFMLTSFAGIR